MGNVVLILDVDDEPDAVARDTRQLLSNISDRIDAEADLMRGDAEDGTRAGGTLLLGQIAMALISSGSVVALLEIAKAYFMRKRSGKFVVTRADGASISVEMDDISDDHFESTVERLFAFSKFESEAR